MKVNPSDHITDYEDPLKVTLWERIRWFFRSRRFAKTRIDTVSEEIATLTRYSGGDFQRFVLESMTNQNNAACTLAMVDDQSRRRKMLIRHMLTMRYIHKHRWDYLMRSNTDFQDWYRLWVGDDSITM